MDVIEQARKRARQKADNAQQASNDVAAALPTDSWPDLVPFDAQEPPPPFPLEVYTANVRRVIDEATLDTRAAVDYAAGAILSTAASAIGGTCKAVGKGRWAEHPALWIVLVGLPSEKKTPSASIIQSPLMAANGRRIKLAEKNDRKAKQDASIAGTDDDCPRIYGNDEGLIVVQTCTTEGLARAFSRQRRGILYTRSELTGWIEGLNQYKSGKGDDRQFFIEAYDGKTHTKQLTSGVVHCPNVCLNMFGGLQPAVVAKFLGVSDGLDARLLPIYPACRVATKEDWKTVSVGTMSAWSAIVQRLLSQEMAVACDDETGEVTHSAKEYRMDHAAIERWVDYTQWGADLQNDQNQIPKVKEWLGKHEGFGLRVAITLRMLAEADCETRPPDTITAIDIERTAKLMQYFYGMVRRLYGSSGIADKDHTESIVRWIVAWCKKIVEEQGQTAPMTFTERDCLRGNNTKFREAKEVSIMCWRLRDYGYIREVPKHPNERRGTSIVWEVNPKAL